MEKNLLNTPTKTGYNMLLKGITNILKDYIETKRTLLDKEKIRLSKSEINLDKLNELEQDELYIDNNNAIKKELEITKEQLYLDKYKDFEMPLQKILKQEAKYHICEKIINYRINELLGVEVNTNELLNLYQDLLIKIKDAAIYELSSAVELLKREKTVLVVSNGSSKLINGYKDTIIFKSSNLEDLKLVLKNDISLDIYKVHIRDLVGKDSLSLIYELYDSYFYKENPNLNK